MYISRIWGEETPKPIWIKFGIVVDVPDVITYANFGDHRLGGFWVARGQIFPSPIDFHRRPYNTLALPCESVIFGTLSFPTDDTCANSLLTFRRLLNMFCSNSPTLTLSTDISNQRPLKWPRHLGLGLPDLPYFTGDPVFQPPSRGRKPPGRRNLPYLTMPIGLIERLVS